MSWLTLKAWPWLKKNWKWLLFPLGILIFIVGYGTRKQSVVVAPELLGAAEDKKKAEEKAAGEITEAKEDRDKQLAEIEKEHADVVAKLTQGQKEQLEELKKDPEKLNKFLIDLGKSIREG